MDSDRPEERVARDVYRAKPEAGVRGYPIGPLGTHEQGPLAPCAIGFCTVCGANARRTCSVRGVFECPNCRRAWYDDRVGEQTRSFDDYFSEASHA